jgi:DMSO/TMAO reductase YedYZ molybdopterin-dependent catalytic subunit
MKPYVEDLEVDPDRVVPPPSLPRVFGPLSGLVSGGIAVAVGLLLAGLFTAVSPIDAVGSVVIDHVPLGVKEFAVERFGTSDKLALRIGIYSILAIAAMALGYAAVRRPRLGAAGIVGFGLVGTLAASSRPNQPSSAWLPSLAGGIIGGALLYYLAGLLRPSDPLELPGRSKVPLGMDRRRFLVTSGGAAAAAVVAGTAARGLENQRVSTLNASRPKSLPAVASTSPSSTAATSAATAATSATATTSTASAADGFVPFITPNADFYRIDTAQSFPNIDIKTWKMDVKGMVNKPVSLTYADLLAMPQVERTMTLACVSNPVGGDLIGNAVFQGVLLQDVLDLAGIMPGAEQVYGESVDGFSCGFPVTVLDGRNAMIAIGMNGEALPLAHGFPARVVVPGLYGYVSATKWLRSITLTTWNAETGYWIDRGWSRDGPIKTESRIDVPRRGDTVAAGIVRLAGVAWAQHRGIEKVEVRVDKGPWQAATLAPLVTDDSWRQWYADVTITAGRHAVQVRATDKTGEAQTEEVADVAPNGATGLHTRTVNAT